MFNVGVSSQGGITYDCRTGTLWVANEGGCRPSGECGVTGSVTNYTLSGTALSSTFFGGSGALNDLTIDHDGTFWAHGNSASGAELMNYDSTGAFINSFSFILGADTIFGALGAVSLRRRRR